MQLRDDYFAAYRSLKLTRDAAGVLVVDFTPSAGRSNSLHKVIRSLSMPFTGSPKIERTRLSFRQEDAGSSLDLMGRRDHSKIWQEANLIFDRASFCRITEPGPSFQLASAILGRPTSRISSGLIRRKASRAFQTTLRSCMPTIGQWFNRHWME